jgi:uncharacterized protein YbbC (DUF1343 family)
VTFTPRGADDGKYENQRVRGVRLQVTDRRVYDPTGAPVALLVEVRRSAADSWAWRPEAFDRLAGTDRVRLLVEAGASADRILSEWTADLDGFAATRANYLLYP